MYPYYYYVNTPYVQYVYPYRHVQHYPTMNPVPWVYPRNYPQVNPSMLMKSANKMQTLVKEATLVLGKISASKQFSVELMDAAQKSNKARVESMITSTGVTNLPEITYSPTGLHLKFNAEVEKVDCCHLIIDLRWE